MIERLFIDELDKLGPFEDDPIIVIGVSGGSDSLALAILAKLWTKKNNGKIIALTVDHQLRKESINEAKKVKMWLEKYDIEHHILTWDGKKPKSNIQSLARKERYKLMTEWCKQNHSFHLLTGHHKEDQVETFFIRLERGSGVDGLSSMPTIQIMNGIRILRPLLNFTKDQLQNYLSINNQLYLNDPSNLNEKFTRVKIRNIINNSDLCFNRINNTVKQLAKARNSIEQSTYFKMVKSVKIHNQGYVTIEKKKIFIYPIEEILRIILSCLKTIGGKEERSRFTKLYNLYIKLKTNTIKHTTLAGCIIINNQDTIYIIPESKDKIPTIIKKGQLINWRNRFLISLAKDSHFDKLAIGNLTEQEWGIINKDKKTREYIKLTNIPNKLIFSLPTFKDIEKLVAVPHIKYYNEIYDLNDITDKIRIYFNPLYSLSRSYFKYNLDN